MLRFTVLALLLANAGYYTWSQGMLSSSANPSAQEAEPQHLTQQIAPEALHILPKAGKGGVPSATISPPEEVAPPPPLSTGPTIPSKREVGTPTLAASPPALAPFSVSTTPSDAPLTPEAPATPATVAPIAAVAAVAAVASVAAAAKPDKPPAPVEARTICLQAGAFDENQANRLRKALGRLPANAGSWNLNSATLPSRWMVYMGKFPDNDSLNKKRNELRNRDVSYDRPRIAELEPGLSLGRYSSEEAAQRALAQLSNKGVRSARVVPERAETPAFVLQLSAVPVDARQRVINTLRPALAGKTLRPCQGD